SRQPVAEKRPLGSNLLNFGDGHRDSLLRSLLVGWHALRQAHGRRSVGLGMPPPTRITVIGLLTSNDPDHIELPGILFKMKAVTQPSLEPVLRPGVINSQRYAAVFQRL